MKTLFILLLLVTTGRSWAQEAPPPPLPVDAHTKLITYSAVVPTPGVTQANLLVRAKAWANRVSVPTKPPLFLNEMGTDVLLVAVAQQLAEDDLLSTTRLYLLVQVSLREGRYQYRFDEFTFETGGGTIFPVEETFLKAEPTTKSDKRVRSHVRTQFEQAVSQVAANLNEYLLTPLVPTLANGTSW